MKKLAAVLLLLAIPAFAGAKKPIRMRPVRVFVFTAPAEGGFVDADSKAKEDSIKDLSKALLKKKGVELARSLEAADLLAEILGRGYEETGGSTIGRSAWGALKTTPNAAATVRVRFTVGPYSTELVGRAGSEQFFSEWSTCAGDIAGQIDKWIDLNYERLMVAKK